MNLWVKKRVRSVDFDMTLDFEDVHFVLVH